MENWTYGGFAAKYDMDAERIKAGTGIVKVHDIMKPIPKWLRGSIVFCDPPCSQGNLQSFATKAGFGDLPENAYSEFEERLSRVFDEIRPHTIYLEVFKSNFDFWLKYVDSNFSRVAVSDSYYYNKKENKCWIISGCSCSWLRMPGKFDCKDESKIIREICEKIPGGESICDPCMGMGLVGYWANYYGKPFTGTELNPHRLAYLLERIRQRRLTPKKDAP